jgi:DNA-binding beta-propeller fold protein YncE
VANAGSSQNTVVDLTGSGSSITGTAFGSAASVNSPHYLAVDGAGNIWVANKDASSSIGGTVSELSSTGAILSATAGEVGYAHLGLSAGEGIAVDPSGNVWIADNTTSGTAAYSVFELVGAAAPTVTPISLALKNSAVAKKP